jgi:hypothetical protein
MSPTPTTQPVPSASSGPRGPEGVANDGPRLWEGSHFLFRLFFCVFFEMVWPRRHPKVWIISSYHIETPVVYLAPADGVWSSVFAYVLGVLSSMTLPIYRSHHWRWLLLSCVDALGPYSSTATFYLSTTTSSTIIFFVQLKWWRSEDGGTRMPLADVGIRHYVRKLLL